RQVGAAAEYVVFADARRQNGLFGRAVAHAEVDHAGGLFFHVNVDVDLVGRAGHRFGGHVDFAEVTQPVDAVARDLEVARVVPGGLFLAHFAAHHRVAGARVAADLDTAHIDAPARVDVERHVGLVLVAVQRGVGIHVGERVAQFAQVVGNGLGRIVGLGRRKDLAFLGLHQVVDFLVQAQQVARQLDAAHLVGLALVHRDGNVDVLAVGRDRDLRRLDGELQVALVQVERAQPLDVALELLARVFVGVRVPGEPAGRGEVEQVEQVAFGKGFVAHDADLADLGDLALEHVETDAHAVARQRGDGGGDLDAVLALAQVLFLQFEFGPLEHRLVEDAALAEADLHERLGDRLGVEFAHAVERDRRDGRAFLYDHHHDVIVGLDLHVAEEARAVQAAHRLGGVGFRELLADLDRQVAEHGAGVGALNAFYADIPHDKRVERMSQSRHEQRSEQARHDALFVMKHPKRHVLGYPRSSKWRRILFDRPSGEQAREIVEQGQPHEPGQQADAGALADVDPSIGRRAAAHNFDEIVQQMPTVEHRYRQQVQYAQADADERQIGDIGRDADARGLASIIGDGHRTADIAPGNLPDHHAAHHAQRQPGGIPGAHRGPPYTLEHTVTDGHHGQVAAELHADAADGLALHRFGLRHHGQRHARAVAHQRQRQRLAGMLLDDAHQFGGIGVGGRPDGDDAVARAQARLLAGPAGDDFAHDGLGRRHAQPGVGQGVALRRIHAVAGHLQREPVGAAVGGADLDFGLAAGREHVEQAPAGVVPGRNLAAVDRQQAVA